MFLQSKSELLAKIISSAGLRESCDRPKFPVTAFPSPSSRPQLDYSTRSPAFYPALSAMDASALLAKQGWRGAGHGLGSTGHGIARPLLISNKQDALGLGKKKIQVADQWWMRAYDNGLKELGTGKQVRSRQSCPWTAMALKPDARTDTTVLDCALVDQTKRHEQRRPLRLLREG